MGGLLGSVLQGEMVPEFEKISFLLNEGDVSGVFETEFGYHNVIIDLILIVILFQVLQKCPNNDAGDGHFFCLIPYNGKGVTLESVDTFPVSTTTKAIDLATASVNYKDNVLLGGDINIVHPNKLLDPLFLSYMVRSNFKKDIARLAQGITIIHLYNSHLKILNIPIPYRDEQKKIAVYFIFFGY